MYVYIYVYVLFVRLQRGREGGREGGGQLLGQSQRSVSKRDLDPHPHIHSVLTISVQPLTPTGHPRLWVVEINWKLLLYLVGISCGINW